ncbi:MAG: hypothetical protein ABF413_09085, partial [Liquorilactobacillus mali]
MKVPVFEKEKLNRILKKTVDRTLGEIDKNRAFDKTKNHPKVTGIAGDVIEKSVLCYDSNSDQRPDIIVDGLETEVKTTGIRYSTSSKHRKKQTNKDFE